MTVLSKFQGCLIGCAVGDAVGAPVERKKAFEIEEYVRKHVSPKDFQGVVRGSRPFGQYTDDTQLTRELACSLVAHKRLNPADFSRRMVRLFSTGRLNGYGRATASAIEKLMEGKAWYESGSYSAGNGSAMRAAPIGLAFSQDFQGLESAARVQSIITHAHNEASVASIVVSYAVALAVQSNILHKESFLKKILALKSVAFSPLGHGLTSLPSFFGNAPGFKEYLLKMQMAEPQWEGGISPYSTTTVLWSLFSFLEHPESFWDALTLSLFPGGDVDTTAAIAGAISGAYLGLEAIPAGVAERLTDFGAYGFTFLKNLGFRMYSTFHEEI